MHALQKFGAAKLMTPEFFATARTVRSLPGQAREVAIVVTFNLKCVCQCLLFDRPSAYDTSHG